MNRIFVTLFFIGFFIYSTGCKTKKLIAPTPPVVEVLKPSASELLVKQLKMDENHFEYYSARGEAVYKDGNNEQNFNVNLVMEKDKYIWVSITAFYIEAFRIYLKPDSVYVLDKLHRKCMVADFSYLKNISNIPLEFSQLQQLIIGNPVFEPDEKKSVADSTGITRIIYNTLGERKQTSIYNLANKLDKNIIEERNSVRRFSIEYSNPVKDGQNLYPSKLNINIRAEKNMECTFTLGNFAFEKKKEVSFSIPGSYEIIKP